MSQEQTGGPVPGQLQGSLSEMKEVATWTMLGGGGMPQTGGIKFPGGWALLCCPEDWARSQSLPGQPLPGDTQGYPGA